METIIVIAAAILVVRIAVSVRAILRDGYHRQPTLSAWDRLH
jgi:hypothetical protein